MGSRRRVTRSLACATRIRNDQARNVPLLFNTLLWAFWFINSSQRCLQNVERLAGRRSVAALQQRERALQPQVDFLALFEAPVLVERRVCSSVLGG